MSGPPPLKATVIGLWHLGSTAAACLADLGCAITATDLDAERVRRVGDGRAPLYEPGLDDLLAKQIREKRLEVRTDMAEAVRGASHVIIAYDTPVDDEDRVDLTVIWKTVEVMIPALTEGVLICVSSQVPVGTCHEVARRIREGRPNLAFEVACVPENLRLGQAIERYKKQDLLILGADSPAALRKAERLFCEVEGPRFPMDILSAEMTKHALNTFLAMSVSFGNEIGNFCDLVGADALKVVQGLRADPRVGPKAMIAPGLGFAGGTIPRDLKVLADLAAKNDYPATMIRAAQDFSDYQNRIVVRRLEKRFGSLKGRQIAVWGLTYKAGTSTLRRSQSLFTIEMLAGKGARVVAHDPKADREELKSYGYFRFVDDPYEAVQGAEALVLMTEWPEYRDLDYTRVAKLMKAPLVIDPKNVLSPAGVAAAGLDYWGLGRGRT